MAVILLFVNKVTSSCLADSRHFRDAATYWPKVAHCRTPRVSEAAAIGVMLSEFTYDL